MIRQIARSMVESIALLSFRFNVGVPHFNAEAYDIFREGERFARSRRYAAESAEVSSQQIEHAVELCRLLRAPVTPARQIEAALPDPEWLALLEAEARLRDAPYVRQREIEREIGDASVEWAGKMRSCPKCQTSFKSNFNMGQCTNCSFIFYASHPELGDARDWMIRLRRDHPSGEQAN